MKTPETASEITTEWLEETIEHSAGSCAVSTFEVDEDFGAKSTIADVVRVKLTHESVNCGPNSVIIKFPPSSGMYAPTLGRVSAFAKEARVYDRLKEHPQLAVPRMLASREGNIPEQVVVVLEDMSPATAGSQVEGCSVETARTVLLQMAEIHGLFWEDEDLPENPSSAMFAQMWNRIGASKWPPFVERYADQLEPTMDTWTWMHDNPEPIAQHRRGRPSTLIHGDLHIENILFTADPERPTVIIDWQLLGRGKCAHDVSYFLVGNLSVDDRRSSEVQLLADYFSALDAHKLVEYSFDEFYLDYRAALTRSMIRPVFALGRASEQPGETEITQFADAMFVRLNAAILDLDPLEAMRELGLGEV